MVLVMSSDHILNKGAAHAHIYLSFVAGSPAVFWMRLFPVPPSDPTEPSTATAFKVAPLTADVDGLKKAFNSQIFFQSCMKAVEHIRKNNIR